MTSGPAAPAPLPGDAAAPAPSAAPRTPALVSGVVVTALLVALAAVALTSRQDPPPTVAELAPQAVAQIEEALADQAGTLGSGGGSGLGATTTTTAAPLPGGGPPTTAPVEEPRVRRCIGDPPRQTEDPQSPPCVPYFDGDNGGATTAGVTADEIRVVYPLQAFENASLAYTIADYFNTRYEFYGRKI